MKENGIACQSLVERNFQEHECQDKGNLTSSSSETCGEKLEGLLVGRRGELATLFGRGGSVSFVVGSEEPAASSDKRQVGSERRWIVWEGGRSQSHGNRGSCGRVSMWAHSAAGGHFANLPASSRTETTSLFALEWIGRGGPISWPARSPDLTPLDYFLWGHIKDVIYETLWSQRKTCWRVLWLRRLLDFPILGNYGSDRHVFPRQRKVSPQGHGKALRISTARSRNLAAIPLATTITIAEGARTACYSYPTPFSCSPKAKFPVPQTCQGPRWYSGCCSPMYAGFSFWSAIVYSLGHSIFGRIAWPTSATSGVCAIVRRKARDDERGNKQVVPEVNSGRKVCDCEHQSREEYTTGRLDYWTGCSVLLVGASSTERVETKECGTELNGLGLEDSLVGPERDRGFASLDSPVPDKQWEELVCLPSVGTLGANPLNSASSTRDGGRNCCHTLTSPLEPCID
ncbi:hypothetical protein PR048_006003 [Dryococelus australis]|uniref:Uncharacterized protein n=1 Tax=Dryococelus australis TaxID=614101 RepID=A0ABQ9I9S6_9NEOP|nr:hypothetical protein PR048_006003 [Dryococelus australis]